MRMQSSTETSSISYLLAVPISCNWIIREICSHCPSDQLNHARALASSGNVTAALVEYQKLFTGVMPPKELVSEYYLTMSGDPNYYQRALTGLVNYIKTNANDVNAQITYGKILSYRR